MILYLSMLNPSSLCFQKLRIDFDYISLSEGLTAMVVRDVLYNDPATILKKKW